MVRPKFDGIFASTPSMIRIRLACEADSVPMLPLPESPVSMSMSMPSKLYFLRIGTTVATNRSATALEPRSMPAAAPPIDIRMVAPAAFAWHISAGVATFTVASMPSAQSTVPSERMTGNAALITLYPCWRMRASVIGTQPNGGCTPFEAPSQFSQYPWSTLPAGFDLTAHVPDVGGGVAGTGGGVVVGGGAEGVWAGGVGTGGGVAAPPHAPRSFHSAGTAAGVHPAPGGGVCVTRAS